MKHIVLLIAILAIGIKTKAQVVCSGISPASISGNYNFDWSNPANGWSSPDFTIPGTYITGELVLVDDGSVGNSPASGLPLANYGCATLLNSVSGKIAVVYRYDGVTASTICWMSEKAKYAQDAGAIGVVIVNRPGASEVLGNGGGTAASTVTIPVAMISYEDGAILRAEMQNGPVTLFLGNKTGLYANDLGIVADSSLISKYSSIPSGMAQNGTDFNFELGTRIYNYGTANQSVVNLTATVIDPLGATVYNNTVGPFSINSGDSADIYPGTSLSLPTFSLPSYPEGKYTLTYSVTSGNLDEYSSDNIFESVFYVSPTLFSFSTLDPLSEIPKATAGYRPTTSNSTYSTCLVINVPSSNTLNAEGLYFSASTAYGSGNSLQGEEMSLSLLEWNDNFTNLNDVNLTFNSLNQVTYGYYYYDSDLQNETVYGTFSVPFNLSSNQRYLACVQTVNTAIYLGHDIKNDYTWNTAHYLQPFCPNESDGSYYALGFGENKMPAIGLSVCDASVNIWCGEGLEEKSLKINAYPNPATDIIHFQVDHNETVGLSATDINGKSILSFQKINPLNGLLEISLENLDSGMYLFYFELENGKKTQMKIVKK